MKYFSQKDIKFKLIKKFDKKLIKNTNQAKKLVIKARSEI